MSNGGFHVPGTAWSVSPTRAVPVIVGGVTTAAPGDSRLPLKFRIQRWPGPARRNSSRMYFVPAGTTPRASTYDQSVVALSDCATGTVINGLGVVVVLATEPRDCRLPSQ